jgi:membrane-bound lytic murein transglycosylase B
VLTAAFGALLLWCGLATAATAQKTLRPEVESFIAEMVSKHRFEREALRRAFGQVQPQPAIIRAMTAPATARPWYEFRSRAVDPNIDSGIRFWEENAATLARASREFGVPEEIIVATLGIETRYGRQTGSFKILDALTMLAFDYPQRAEYFRKELEEYLLLTREAGLDLPNVRGSYAGAIGLPQFLPSSYRKYAVDFDGDGRRDLGQAADSIGSVANYYRSFGWKTGQPIVIPAVGSEIDAILDSGVKPSVKVGEFKRRGVTPLRPVSDDAEAVLFAVETESGPAYWLGLQNFYVITRYNRSINYAMAIQELARALRASVKPGAANE